MGLLLAELEKLRQEWRREVVHPMLGPASLHVPLLSGGRQLFIYAGGCEARLECRTVPGQTRDRVQTRLKEILDDLGRRIENFQGRVEAILWQDGYEIDPGRPLVRKVLAAASAVRGEEARVIGHPWWEDSALLGAAGIETVILGPRGEGLHTEEEWVEVDSVIQLAEILHRSTVDWCGID